VKLDSRQVAGFLRNPGETRLILLYGDDEGLVRERAQALTRQVAGNLNDPFRVVEIERETWPQIPSEMAALSMVGGRRVIRVREVAEALLPHVSNAMKGPGDALLILEAPGLGKGKLRNFAEASKDAACISCYPEEGRALQELIKTLLLENKIAVEPEALAWLGETLGGDRAAIRGEIEKLVLLCGPGATLTLDTARGAVGENSSALGDDGLLLATSGEVAQSDAAVEAAIADGLNGVGLLRIALMHLQKMHLARLRIAQGLAASEAVRGMRPPVFGPAAGKMTASLGLWPEETLLRAIEELRLAELACKQTGSRPELLARAAIARVARLAASRRARHGSRPA
jgi:DNA polymerase-3 subunit delta